MTILAVSGSLRAGSFNTALLRAAAEELPDGFELELVPSDALAAVPPYDADLDARGSPEPVVALKRAFAGADGVLFATPEYNASIPGQLKNVLDWISRPIAESPLRGRPVVVVGASASAYGAVWAQADLRKVLGILGARVLEAEVAVAHAAERFDAAGRLVDGETRGRLGEALAALVGEIEASRELARA